MPHLGSCRRNLFMALVEQMHYRNKCITSQIFMDFFLFSEDPGSCLWRKQRPMGWNFCSFQFTLMACISIYNAPPLGSQTRPGPLPISSQLFQQQSLTHGPSTSLSLLILASQHTNTLKFLYFFKQPTNQSTRNRILWFPLPSCSLLKEQLTITITISVSPPLSYSNLSFASYSTKTVPVKITSDLLVWFLSSLTSW